MRNYVKSCRGSYKKKKKKGILVPKVRLEEFNRGGGGEDECSSYSNGKNHQGENKLKKGVRSTVYSSNVQTVGSHSEPQPI